jgi:alanyl-tRNA synthetase
LYETHGYPLELILDFAALHGLSVDEKGFNELLTLHRERSKKARNSTSA